MAVPVQSKTVPQPARTEHLPQNSLGILPGAGDAKQPSGSALPAVQGSQGQAQAQRLPQNQMPGRAYAAYHPAAKTAALHPLVGPALGGIAAVGMAAAGVHALRKKRREHLDKLRDNMWKEDAKASLLTQPANPYRLS
jgi:hypothetical protein